MTVVIEHISLLLALSGYPPFLNKTGIPYFEVFGQALFKDAPETNVDETVPEAV